MTCSTVIEGLEALVDDLNSADFVIESSLTQGQVKDEVKDEVKEDLPQTLDEAGALLPVKATGQAVKNRLLLISSKCDLPMEFLTLPDGGRIGLTQLGWDILRELPHAKGKPREDFFKSVDVRFADQIREQEQKLIPVADSEIVEEPDEEISSAEFSAIVKHKMDSLSIPVAEAVSIAPIINFSDFGQVQTLAYLAGQQMGVRIGAQIAAGINDGIRKSQEGLRGEMLQSLEGVE